MIPHHAIAIERIDFSWDHFVSLLQAHTASPKTLRSYVASTGQYLARSHGLNPLNHIENAGLYSLESIDRKGGLAGLAIWE